jgi:integrase
MNIQFNLRNDKVSLKTGLIPLRITVTFEGFRVRKTVPKVNVKKEHWNLESQRIIPSKKGETYNYAREYNSDLDEIKSRLSKYWSHNFVTKSEITKEGILHAINNTQRELDKDENHSLLPSFYMFIEQNKSHRAKRTITGYRTTYNMLQTFIDEKKPKVLLSELDLAFFDQLRNYCFEEKKYMNNTFAKVMNNFKAFMAWAEDRNLHKNSAYHKFKAFEENIEVIYLTKDELFHLFNFKFELERLAKVRDIYCFACFTGLRYSDLANLKPSNIHDEFLKITVAKTRDNDQVIPLSKYAKSILENYKDTIYYPLPMISSQKLNEYIKEACKKAEINTLITITRYSGTNKIERTVPKHELLTLHTGRKTFVTNSLVLGMNPMVVRGITGHRSDSAFRKYVKVADDVKGSELSKFWDNI